MTNALGFLLGNIFGTILDYKRMPVSALEWSLGNPDIGNVSLKGGTDTARCEWSLLLQFS